MATTEATDEVIEQALRTARQVTGLDLAYVSAFADGEQVIEAVSADDDRVRVSVGDRLELEGSFCQRMVDGRIPNAVADTTAHPEIGGLAITENANARAYLGVPIRLRGGALYGSFCVVGADPAEMLSDDHVASMRMLSSLVADRLDDALERTAQRRAQDEFFASVSHDLRGPLTPIRGYAELLRDAGGDPERVRAAADAIARNAERLDRLIGDLLTVARARTGDFTIEPQPVDLGAIAADAVADAAQAAGREVRLDAPAGPVVVDGDAGRLRQLLDNLLSNALKYSPDGGAVDVALRPDGPIVVLTVADRGIGVDPADLERLFGHYARAASALERGIPGTGLGLTICRAIAGAHEGTIHVASRRGAGTTVTVRLPVRRQA